MDDTVEAAISCTATTTNSSGVVLSYLTLPYLTLPYLRGGQVVTPASAEAVSVRPNAQPRCNQRSQ